MTIKKDTISRRHFLALTSKAVSAGLVLGVPTLSRGIAPPRQAALIGYGQRGAGFWQQAVLPHLTDKVRLSFICDPDPARQKLIHKTGPYGIVRHSQELLHKPDIDTLIIASPDNSHTPLIQNFMSPNKQLLCELPLAISKSQYQQLSQLRKTGPNNIHPVLTERLRPVWKRVKTLIAQKNIGDVLAVDFHVYRSQTNTARIFNNWQGQAESTGSWLIHEGVRHFDLVNWWLDREPVAVSASGKIQATNSGDIFQNDADSQNRKKLENWNSYTVQVKYEDNVFLNYSLNGAMSYDGCRLVINGLNGQIESWLFNRDQATHQGIRIWNSETHRQQLWEKTIAGPEQLATELWQQCSTTDDKALQSSLAANLIAIEATNSIRTHQPIRIKNSRPHFG